MNPDSLDWQTDEVPLLSHLPQAPLELGARSPCLKESTNALVNQIGSVASTHPACLSKHIDP